jgi:hypothetical protein
MKQPWEMRNHDICFASFRLQQRQLLHARQVEKAALMVKDKNGQPYFTGGWVSSMNYAMRCQPAG